MDAVAAIVLAGGRGQRFGTAEDDSKLLARFAGQPLVRRAVLTALASRATPVVVVTGQAAWKVEASLADLDATIVPNPDYATGLASSLKAGLSALPADVKGALILLADMPLVRTETLDRLIARFVSEPALEAVVPVFEGRRGNPVLIARGLFGEVADIGADEGARRLLSAPGRKVATCLVEERGIEIDVDTRAALDGLETD